MDTRLKPILTSANSLDYDQNHTQDFSDIPVIYESRLESVKSGVIQLIDKGEDTFYERFHKEFKISSFGIFDGHAGSYSSKKCSTELHDLIIRHFTRLLTSEFKLWEQNFCEAILCAVNEIDSNIKNQSDDGTTALLLISMNKPDGSTLVLCAWIGDSRCVMYRSSAKYFVSALPMSEDHKPNLARECCRINENLEPYWTGLPIDAESMNQLPAGKKKIVEGQCSSVDMQDILASSHGFRPSRNGSFINERMDEHRPNWTGPLAVHSRYNVSLTMTRSVGDRWGPRSCIAVPDITSTTIPRDQHARFVLASDGLWDVVSTEEVRQAVFLYEDPQTVAERLANMAFAKRSKKGNRMDDITVLVVDVHPDMCRIDSTPVCTCTVS